MTIMNWTGGKTKRKFYTKHSQSKNKLFFSNSNSNNQVQNKDPIIENAHKSYKNFSPNSTTSSLYCDDVSEAANVVQLINEEINEGNLTEASDSTYCTFTIPKKLAGEVTKPTVQNDFTGYENMKEQVIQLKRKVIWLETMVLKMNDALQLLTKRN